MIDVILWNGHTGSHDNNILISHSYQLSEQESREGVYLSDFLKLQLNTFTNPEALWGLHGAWHQQVLWETSRIQLVNENNNKSNDDASGYTVCNLFNEVNSEHRSKQSGVISEKVAREYMMKMEYSM